MKDAIGLVVGWFVTNYFRNRGKRNNSLFSLVYVNQLNFIYYTCTAVGRR